MPASVRGGEKEDYGQGEVGETNGLVAAARSHLTGAPTPKHHIGIPWQGEGVEGRDTGCRRVLELVFLHQLASPRFNWQGFS